MRTTLVTVLSHKPMDERRSKSLRGRPPFVPGISLPTAQYPRPIRVARLGLSEHSRAWMGFFLGWQQPRLAWEGFLWRPAVLTRVFPALGLASLVRSHTHTLTHTHTHTDSSATRRRGGGGRCCRWSKHLVVEPAANRHSIWPQVLCSFALAQPDTFCSWKGRKRKQLGPSQGS